MRGLHNEMRVTQKRKKKSKCENIATKVKESWKKIRSPESSGSLESLTETRIFKYPNQSKRQQVGTDSVGAV